LLSAIPGILFLGATLTMIRFFIVITMSGAKLKDGGFLPLGNNTMRFLLFFLIYSYKYQKLSNEAK
jgi:hypothetical protein